MCLQNCGRFTARMAGAAIQSLNAQLAFSNLGDVLASTHHLRIPLSVFRGRVNGRSSTDPTLRLTARFGADCQHRLKTDPPYRSKTDPPRRCLRSDYCRGEAVSLGTT